LDQIRFNNTVILAQKRPDGELLPNLQALVGDLAFDFINDVRKIFKVLFLKI